MSDLTVILLTYNREEKYLRAAIEGILNQSMKDFEFIIYDNGSEKTDVKKIADDYEGIRVIRQEKNKNSYEHWTDFRKLSRDFLVVTHDDDIMRPNMLEEEYAIIKSADDIKMVGCNASIIDNNGNVLLEKLFYKDGIKTEFNQNERLLTKFATEAEDVIPTYPSVMYRKSALDKVDFSFFKTVGKGDDLYLMFSVDKLPGRTVISHKCLYEYRIHKGQDSRHVVDVIASGKKSIDLLEGIASKEDIERRRHSFDVQIAEAKANEKVRNFITEQNLDVSDMIRSYQENVTNTQFRYGYKQILFFSQVVAYLKERYNKKFDYIIWGLGSGGQKTKYLLDLWYPESRCIMYLDSWQHGGEKDGIPICNVDDFSFNKRNLIFLCGAPAQELENRCYSLLDDYLFGYNAL